MARQGAIGGIVVWWFTGLSELEPRQRWKLTGLAMIPFWAPWDHWQ